MNLRRPVKLFTILKEWSKQRQVNDSVAKSQTVTKTSICLKNYQFCCLFLQEHYTPITDKQDVLSEIIHWAVSLVKALHLRLVRDVINDWNTTLSKSYIYVRGYSFTHKHLTGGFRKEKIIPSEECKPEQVCFKFYHSFMTNFS